MWASYRYGRLTELPEVSGTCDRTHRSSGQVQKMLYPYPGYCDTGRTVLTEVPGTGMSVNQNSQEFRVRVTELTEVPGIVAQAYRTHRSSEQV